MRIVALAGGVGAAKLLSGLVHTIPPEDLTVIVNTGDDFYWMGLHVSPDLDTIIYTLAQLANPDTGWGIRGDTFHTLERLKELGFEPWFRIGDRDLATHISRTIALRSGRSLSEVTRTLCAQNGLRCHLLPMTDQYVPTQVQTDEGLLDFQDYFVRRRCQPNVRGFTFRGIEQSEPAPGVLECLRVAEAVIICPSNPFISIGPILAVPGIRAALRECPATVLAVSPIIAGQAVKGPTADMLRQLGKEVSAVGVADLYRDFVDIFVLDSRDAGLKDAISSLHLEARIAATLMETAESKIKLARALLEMFG